MTDSLKIHFLRFVDMDTSRDGKLTFEEFFDGLTPESAAALEKFGFYRGWLPNPPKETWESNAKGDRVPMQPKFFKNVFAALNDNKNRFLDKKEIEGRILNPEKDGLTLEVVKVDTKTQEGFRFNYFASDNGWPETKPKA